VPVAVVSLAAMSSTRVRSVCRLACLSGREMIGTPRVLFVQTERAVSMSRAVAGRRAN
jgi:hypothetical protein